MKSGEVVCIVVQSQIHITMLPYANTCYFVLFDPLIGFVDKVEYVHDINIEMLEKKNQLFVKAFDLF